VGAPPQEDDGVPFEEKMAQLTATLKDQFTEGERPEAKIGRTGYGL
jgi:type I restriction enzyme M protein